MQMLMTFANQGHQCILKACQSLAHHWEEPKTPGMLLLKTTESIVACDLCLLKIAHDLKLVMWKCDVYIRSEFASALAVSPDGHHQLDVKFADSSEAEMQSVLRVRGIHNPLISCGKSTIHVRILVSLAVSPGHAWAARFHHVIIIFPEVDAKVDCGYSGYRSVAPSHAPEIQI